MNRDKWLFTYIASDLLAAAKTKMDFHKSRLAWWEAKKKETVAKIKAEGIEIDESLAEEAGKFSNSYRGATVQIRNDLITDMDECIAKVNEHRKKVTEYESWIQVFASQGKAKLELHQDDWLFFFGK